MSAGAAIQGGRGIFAVSGVRSHLGRSVESLPRSLPMLGDIRPPHEATTRRYHDVDGPVAASPSFSTTTGRAHVGRAS